MSDSTLSPPMRPAARKSIHDKGTNPSDINVAKGKGESFQLPPSDVYIPNEKLTDLFDTDVPRRPNPNDNFRPDSSLDSSQNATLTDDENNGHNESRDDRSSVPREAVPLKREPPSPPCPKPDSDHRSQSNSTSFVYLAVALAVLVAVIGLWCMYPQSQPQATPEHFLQLHSKYPNTDDLLWTTLITSVDRAINADPGEPSTFIFLYNSSSVGQSLLDDVTRIAIKCFGSGGAIWRTSNDFETTEIAQDSGTALDLYRKELQSQRVLVVQELDRIPPTAALVLFTICDSYEPLVHRAVIFFTIDISRQPRQENRSATEVAEEILKRLWRDELHPNVLDPLVVRLTENVFRID